MAHKMYFIKYEYSVSMNQEAHVESLLPLAAYVFATTFTPGPNNITAAQAGARVGLGRSLPYLYGIAAGFLVVMLASGLFAYAIQGVYAPLIRYMKWLGFAYMLWLCVSIFLKGGGKGEKRSRGLGFASGFFLQFLNPKVILYGITLYGAFAGILLASGPRVLASSLALTAVGFASIATWCVVGSTLTRLLADARRRLAFDLVLAALLLYSAFAMLLE
jgi:cysteine/O-acetylserine efflux protein